MKQSGNTILMTGGTSGIGRELALRFRALGNRVVVAGRRQDLLDEITSQNSGISGYVLDVEDPRSIADVARRVTVDHPDLNVLFNNAGIMRLEDFTASRDLSDAEAMVVTNLLGPIRLVDALIGHLSQKPDAAIVNVTSGLAYTPLTAAPTYSATKAAIHSYTVALREALKGRIEVIELVPPGVQTGLTPGQESRPGYMPLEEFIEEVMTLFGEDPTPPEILVGRVRPQRNAEADGRFGEAVTRINEMARKAREAQG